MPELPVNDITKGADWLELLLLIAPNGRVGRSKVEEFVEASAPELDESDIERVVEDLSAEIDRRASMAGALYPFYRDLTAIARRDVTAEVQLLYAFLVLSSVVPTFRKTAPDFRPGRLFEHVTRMALEEWVGGVATVFAEAPPGESSGMRAALRRLGKELSLRSFPEHARAVRKDHGLDVAAWRSFRDRRTGHPVVLCQCTLATNLIAKAREVQTGEWSGLLAAREGTFTAALSVPHVLAPDWPHWDELRRNTDLIIERTRLLALLESSDSPWSPAPWIWPVRCDQLRSVSTAMTLVQGPTPAPSAR
jgi:hypothetical protein